MRIAVDARMAGHTGVGRYLRELVQVLAVHDLELTLFLNPFQDEAWIPPRVRIRHFPREVPVYSWKEWTAWKGLLTGFDLFHVPHFNAPWSCPVPMLVTIHDATYWRFPEATGSWLGGQYARFMLQRSVSQARRVIAVSASTGKDVTDLLGADPAKVDVILSGSPEIPARKMGKGNYVLYVGNFLPHKRLDVLLRAMKALQVQGRDLPLHLVGRLDARGQALRQEAQALGIRTRFLGEVDDSGLYDAYTGARLAVSPSPWEGFGFPAVEALAQGVPVVAVDSGASPEVLGGAALYSKPGDAAGMAEAILRVWADEGLRATLLKAGRKRVGELRWEETAHRTVEAYRKAVQ